MININNKKECCGCGACVQKCPKHSISFLEDNEGFLYPKVDAYSCIDCGLCENVCPMLRPFSSCEPLQVLAAINCNEAIRMESSSGGVFTLLAEKVINDGGVVFGARFDEEWQVMLDYTETIEGLAVFRGSKYVQARTGDTYKQCEQFLKNGRKVLYTGTPCQISGLLHYLRKPYNNLLICDFACHGVPSPKVWRMYLQEVIDGTNRSMNNNQFRKKHNYKKAFTFKIFFDEDSKTTTLSSFNGDNPYMKAFHKNMSLRPSCYECKTKQGRSMADITLADYWGIQKTHPEMDDDKGTGLVLINTQKGKEFFDKIEVSSLETVYEEIISSNPVIVRSVNPHPNRDKFFMELNHTQHLSKLILDFTKPSLKQQARSTFSLLKRIVRNHIKCFRWATTETKSNDKSTYPTEPVNIRSLQSVSFRDKTTGWKTYGMVIKMK